MYSFIQGMIKHEKNLLQIPNLKVLLKSGMDMCEYLYIIESMYANMEKDSIFSNIPFLLDHAPSFTKRKRELQKIDFLLYYL